MIFILLMLLSCGGGSVSKSNQRSRNVNQTTNNVSKPLGSRNNSNGNYNIDISNIPASLIEKTEYIPLLKKAIESNDYSIKEIIQEASTETYNNPHYNKPQVIEIHKITHTPLADVLRGSKISYEEVAFIINKNVDVNQTFGIDDNQTAIDFYISNGANFGNEQYKVNSDILSLLYNKGFRFFNQYLNEKLLDNLLTEKVDIKIVQNYLSICDLSSVRDDNLAINDFRRNILRYVIKLGVEKQLEYGYMFEIVEYLLDIKEIKETFTYSTESSNSISFGDVNNIVYYTLQFYSKYSVKDNELIKLILINTVDQFTDYNNFSRFVNNINSRSNQTFSNLVKGDNKLNVELKKVLLYITSYLFKNANMKQDFMDYLNRLQFYDKDNDLYDWVLSDEEDSFYNMRMKYFGNNIKPTMDEIKRFINETL